MTEAAKQVKADQAEVSKDEIALEKVAKPLRDQFAKSAEMTAALAALHDAQAATKAAEAAVIAVLSKDPAYQSAAHAKEDASQKLRKLRESGGAPDEIAAAANVVMEAGAVVTKMESTAESADPKLVQSRKDLAAAVAKITELQKQNEDSIRSDPQWIDAKKTLDDAKAKLASSQAALSAARNQP